VPVIQCQTVTVTIEDNEDGETASLTIPAYTREIEDFRSVVEDHLRDYLYISVMAGTQVSVGDFAMRLLAMAAIEPRTIDA
jgi:hypothetical protein